jgi:hypothetical protein
MSSTVTYASDDGLVRATLLEGMLDETGFSVNKNLTEVGVENSFKTISKTESLGTLDNIQSFTKDWNGYGAEPIPIKVVDLCRNIVMELDIQPEIFPTARCTVQMEYELEDFSYLEFEVYQNRIHIMVVPEGNFTKAMNREIPSDNYKHLAQIVNVFHGGFTECKDFVTM